MAKTKIKLRPDQAAMVFNADGTHEMFLHEQPDDADASPANLACAFAGFALATTPPELRSAIISSVDEDEFSLGVEEIEPPAISMAHVARAMEAAADEAEADIIDVEFEEEAVAQPDGMFSDFDDLTDERDDG